jgi:hypothetical protein
VSKPSSVRIWVTTVADNTTPNDSQGLSSISSILTLREMGVEKNCSFVRADPRLERRMLEAKEVVALRQTGI